MSWARLSRLLKPALLCGALAAPGLAGTMHPGYRLFVPALRSGRTDDQCASRDDWRCARSMHEFAARDIDGHMICLDKYKWVPGYVVDLHARYAECGLRILAFPCNQFGKQEPGTNQEIKEFAASYDVKFDMYSKICVNGDDAHPLWKWMKVQPKGRGMLGNAIKWNFTKFLIDKNGCVMKRYGPMEEPLVIEKDLPCYL
ncbi:Phospholipid hydroperoxide glutathione peroxidase, mitochondrial [Cricetulus griseus]|uniref:Glutathione peroxidase n=1 Tax=Cricetulus griseus TaxID=10029 RepID=G3HF60_CRIGR|nr:Phospholipid hydroperoxide glutathione peroxidase, mitochondrial [Cricetulus griseus]